MKLLLESYRTVAPARVWEIAVLGSWSWRGAVLGGASRCVECRTQSQENLPAGVWRLRCSFYFPAHGGAWVSPALLAISKAPPPPPAVSTKPRWRDVTACASNRLLGFRPHYSSSQWESGRGAVEAGPAACQAEARGPPPASPPTPASAASASRASPAAAGAAPAAEQEPDGQRSPAAPAAAESPGPQVGRELGRGRGWGWGGGAGAGPGAVKHSGLQDGRGGGFRLSGGGGPRGRPGTREWAGRRSHPRGRT